MCRKFKKGDIVWCIEDDVYKITCYHRPCTVMGYDNSGDLLLQAFDQRNSIELNVNEKIFELVAPHKILKTGQMIRIRDLDRQVKFNQYKNNGYIEVFDGEYRREYYVDSIIFEEGFYI